jgi:hypothetical protein
VRGTEYTPLNFINAAFQLVAPLVGGKLGKSFDQRKFVDALSRATVGTGAFFGLGGILAANGIMTGSKSDNSAVADLERGMGGGEYKINLSALKRWVLSGFNDKEAKPKDGDTMMTYDWAQPASISAALGVNYNKAKQTKQGSANMVETMAEGATGMADTLVNQPLFTGMRRAINALAYGGSILKAFADTAKDAPTSFIPTLVNQMKQLTDNTGRETYDPTVWQEALNRVKAKIPGLSQTLPARNKLIGGARETYQDNSNSVFNVMFNPAFVTKLKSDPQAKEVLDLYKSTGETKQLPKFADKKVKLLGQEFQANAEQYAEMQKYLGEHTQALLAKLQANPIWGKLSDDKKVNYLGKQMSEIAKEAKVKTYMQGMGVDVPQWLTPSIQAKLLEKVGKSKKFKEMDREGQARVLQMVVDRIEAVVKQRAANR